MIAPRTALRFRSGSDECAAWIRARKAAAPDLYEFGQHGMTARTFVDAERSNHVGLVVEVADLDTLQQALATPEAADAMKHDGVRPDTVHLMTTS